MNFNRAIDELRSTGRARFTVAGSLYSASVKDDGVIQFTTLVFRADDGYIPRSVRELLMTATIGGQLPDGSSFTVSEDDGMVLMHVVVDALETFGRDVMEFIFLSEEWRAMLNDQGQKDLVPVRA